MAFVNFYEILEVASSATSEEIQQAVRQQRRIWVRRQSSPDPDRRTAAEARVRQLDEAEKTLLNERARAAFDRQLRDRETPREAPQRTGPGGGRQPAGGGPRPDGRGTANRSPATETAAMWTKRGREYFAQGNVGAAYRAALRATGLEADHVEGWLLAGDAAGAQDDLDAAEDAYAEATRLRYADPAGHLGLAEVFLARQDWANGMREFEAVLELDPSSVDARLGIGQIHVASGSANEGMRLIEEVAAEHPDDRRVTSMLTFAIYNATINGLDELENGGRLPNSRRQVKLVQRSEKRIGELGAGGEQEADLRDSLVGLRKDATRSIWLKSVHKRFYLLAILAPLALAFTNSDLGPQVLAGVMMALIVVVYIVRHCKPAWKVRRKELAQQVVRKGV